MNPGAKALGKHCVNFGDQKALAIEFDIDEGRFSKILSGLALPTPTQRARIEDKFPEVGWRLWDDVCDEPESGAA